MPTLDARIPLVIYRNHPKCSMSSTNAIIYSTCEGMRNWVGPVHSKVDESVCRFIDCDIMLVLPIKAEARPSLMQSVFRGTDRNNIWRRFRNALTMTSWKCFSTQELIFYSCIRSKYTPVSSCLVSSADSSPTGDHPGVTELWLQLS